MEAVLACQMVHILKSICEYNIPRIAQYILIAYIVQHRK